MTRRGGLRKLRSALALLQEEPVPIVVRYAIESGSVLDEFRVSEFPGLLFCQVLTLPDGENDELLTEWRSASQFRAQKIAFEKKLGLPAPAVEAPSRNAHYPKVPRKLALYSILATTVAVLGYFKSLREHAATIGRSAEIQIRIPRHEPVVILGAEIEVSVHLRNTRRYVSSFVTLHAPEVTGPSGGLVPIEADSVIFSDLRPGAMDRHTFRLRGKEAGVYRVRIRCEAEAGWFGGKRVFDEETRVEVWPRRSMTRPMVLGKTKSGGVWIQARLKVATDETAPIKAAAQVTREGIFIRRLVTKGVDTWSKEPDATNPWKITWAWPPIRAASSVPCKLRLESDGDSAIDWERLIADGEIMIEVEE